VSLARRIRVFLAFQDCVTLLFLFFVLSREVVISFRKLLLVCGTKLASDDTKVAGMLWIVFVTVAGLVAQVQTWPFASEQLPMHECVLHYASCLRLKRACSLNR
jgi:uncharacterized membrane protein